MKLRSVMEHTFSQIPRAEIQRSSFNRSHGYKTTFDADYLIPIFIDEALPGDTFNLSMTAFARLATPIHPIMDNMFMDFFFFAVPIRLIWENWERFNGAQDNPGDSTDFVVPITTTPVAGFAAGSFYDYVGLPTDVPNIETSALPYRAMTLIWNEWFRDQNLENSLTVQTGDGPDAVVAGGALFRRNKRHDYFTSCLPWPQKGDSVSIPLGTSAPIIPESVSVNSPIWISRAALPFDNVFNTPGPETSHGGFGVAIGAGTQQMETTGVAGAAQGASRIAGWPGDPSGSNMIADLTDATAATINQLRQAFAIQKMLERDARGGTRYTEIVRSHFGVVSPDARLQRPEYLGGGSVPVNINPVPQTGESATTPQGNLAAFGTAVAQKVGFTKSFTEHCVLLGFANVRADLTYQQGINRMWSRQTRFDFYWPALAHIGEQAVLSKEIYADGTANDEDVFGYQERYAEYRYKPSQITGLFRSNHAATLDSWHLSEEFTARPTLNSSFMLPDTPIDRVIAVPTEPHFIFDSYFNLTCARPMPLYGVPGFIDRF